MRLGVKGIKEDERTIRLENHLTPDALLPFMHDTEVDLNGDMTQWPDFGNLEKGDCIVAGACKHGQRVSSLAGKEIVVPKKTALDIYDKLSPDDSGLYDLDFLNWWTKNPIGLLAKLGAFAEVDPKNLYIMRYVSFYFGGLYMVFGLPKSAKTQIDSGRVWDNPTGDISGDNIPWTWGGHCMVCGRTGPWGFLYDTWGSQQGATKRWHNIYCYKAYALISVEFFMKDAKTPQGLDINGLSGQLQAVTGRRPGLT